MVGISPFVKGVHPEGEKGDFYSEKTFLIKSLSISPVQARGKLFKKGRGLRARIGKIYVGGRYCACPE
jgi:hypothetical protein